MDYSVHYACRPLFKFMSFLAQSNSYLCSFKAMGVKSSLRARFRNHLEIFKGTTQNCCVILSFQLSLKY